MEVEEQAIKQEEPLEINDGSREEGEVIDANSQSDEDDSSSECDPLNKMDATIEYGCKICFKTYVRKESLESHIALKHPPECKLCNKTYLSKKKLIEHFSRKHAAEGKLCKICFEILRNQTLWKNHLVTAHDYHDCKNCDELFKTKRALDGHHDRKHEATRPQCPLCSKIYASQSSLEHHIAHKHPLKCEICNENFPYKKKLNEHYSKKHEGQGRMCDLCEEVLDSQATMNKHLITVHKYFQCQICELTFSKSGTLKAHRRRTKHYLKCDQCDKTFGTQEGLDRHHCQLKPTLYTSYECTKCSNFYYSESILENHMALDHSFKCEYCDLAFLAKNLLSLHIFEKHPTQERKCEVCDEVLSNQQNLHSHMVNAHNFIECKVCVKFYLNKDSYRSHVRLQHPMKCEECYESFPLKMLLSQHIFEKHKRKCDHCDEKLGDQVMMNKHLVTVHKYLECDMCDRICENKKSFSNHKRNKHPIKCEYCDVTCCSKRQLYEHYSEKHSEQFAGEEDFIDDMQISKNPIYKKRRLENFSEDDNILVDSIEIVKYECDECSLVFESFHELEYHKKMHIPRLDHLIDGIRKSEEPIDKKRQFEGGNSNENKYKQPKTLKIFEDLIEIGKYECDECSLFFDSFHELENHKKMHIPRLDHESSTSTQVVGSQIYECSTCNIKFELSEDLEKHSKIHVKIENDLY